MSLLEIFSINSYRCSSNIRMASATRHIDWCWDRLTEVRCAARDVTDAIQQDGGQGLGGRRVHHHQSKDDAQGRHRSSSLHRVISHRSSFRTYVFTHDRVRSRAQDRGGKPRKSCGQSTRSRGSGKADWQDEKPPPVRLVHEPLVAARLPRALACVEVRARRQRKFSVRTRARARVIRVAFTRSAH